MPDLNSFHAPVERADHEVVVEFHNLVSTHAIGDVFMTMPDMAAILIREMKISFIYRQPGWKL